MGFSPGPVSDGHVPSRFRYDGSDWLPLQPTVIID